MDQAADWHDPPQLERIPETMHAVVLMGHGGPEQLVYRTDVPVPRPGAGEVLIQVRAAGVNNTDINTRTGWYAASPGASSDAGGWTGDAIVFPRIQGADVCGLVVAVGDGVAEARVGERVIVQGCLRSLGRDGREPWLGSELDGGFAQFVRTPAADTYRVDCELSDVQLAAVPCSYATAENLLHRAAVGARRARARDRRLGRGRDGRDPPRPPARRRGDRRGERRQGGGGRRPRRHAGVPARASSRTSDGSRSTS